MTGWQVATACACAAPGLLLGALLVLRRQRVVGSLLVLLGVMPLLLLSPDSTASSSSPHGLGLVPAVLTVTGWIWFYLPPALLAAVFPNGRLPSHRWRWLFVGWPTFIVLFNVAVAVDPSSYGSGKDQIPGSVPVDLPGWLVTAAGLAALVLLLSLLVGSAACVVTRYRHGTEVVRRQLKWFALGVLLLPSVLVAAWVAYFLTGGAQVVVVVGLLLLFVTIPSTVAIAVLRHDLYDIDRLLSRTVSYVLVSGVLVGVYAAVAVGLGVLIGRGSTFAVALATMAVAVAFGPVRGRIQRGVDARFDRGRRDALTQVARFVDEVRDGTAEPEEIDGTLRAALGDPELRVVYAVTSEPGAPWRDSDGTPVEHPAGSFLDVSAGGRLLACVSYTGAGRRPQLFREVLREAHLPLELARSRIELRQALAQTEASRARLLQAGDEERRRLERDLHDGAQQHLVAIGMSLRLLQKRLQRDDQAHAALGKAVAELQAAIGELRRLASGVRPHALDEGLAPALRQLVRASPVPVQLQVTTDSLPESLVTTAYYVTAEALTNALKHAEPHQVDVDVSRVNGTLHVTVVDDGRGGATLTPGSGLSGLRDRVLATGGDLVVESPPGQGTRVEARLPCAS